MLKFKPKPMKTIIYKGRLITVTMEVPGLSSLDYKRKYADHLESLWQSSTIHASPELMERFKDGETVVEGKDYEIKNIGRTRLLSNGIEAEYKVRIAVPLPAVEEGSQDEMWQELIHEVERHQKRETLYPEVIERLKQQYKLTKI